MRAPYMMLSLEIERERERVEKLKQAFSLHYLVDVDVVIGGVI